MRAAVAIRAKLAVIGVEYTRRAAGGLPVLCKVRYQGTALFEGAITAVSLTPPDKFPPELFGVKFRSRVADMVLEA